MNVAGEGRFTEVTQDHWSQLASQIGLSEENVTDVVSEVVEAVRTHVGTVVDELRAELTLTSEGKQFVDQYAASVRSYASGASNAIRGRGRPRRRW
jgi:predicted transcriptional regulator